MDATSVLTKEVENNKAINNDGNERDMNDMVESASRVIAPLWPISKFAARNPWMGLENQPFQQVADWLKTTRDVDIYPSANLILAAKNNGEIDEAFVKEGLKRWLDSNSFHIPQDVKERFCHAALKLDTLPSELLTSQKLEKLAKNLNGRNTGSAENVPLQPISSQLENQDGERLETILDHHVIKWCKLFLDISQAGWTMPHREKGFYGAWRQLIQYDSALSKSERKSLKDWPQEASMALQHVLSLLEIPKEKIQSYLEGHLLSLPGWAGMMLWRSRQSNDEQTLLTEYLAVRISMEYALLKPYLPLSIQHEKKASITTLIAAWIHWGDLTMEEWSTMSAAEQAEYLSFAYEFNDHVRRKIWLEAWEQTYTDRLSQMIRSTQRKINDRKSALAQLAFCIDVRSEPFRRHLEKEGPFETIGVAGFFNLPIATSELGSNHSHPSLPIILEPEHRITESAEANEFETYQQRKQTINSVSYTFKEMKQNVFSSLLLPEISGPWLSLQTIARSFVPKSAERFLRNLRKTWLRKPNTELSINHVCHTETELPIGFSEEEKVMYARRALQMMGLTENFAPLVVICGHVSQSINNPYAAALDCGACGGASGGFNARVLATLCNLPEVRKQLSSSGIEIPEETVFAAAEHNTTVDKLQWIYVPKLSEAAQEAFNRIEAVMPKVSYHVNAERLAQLPHHSKPKNIQAEVQRFAEDWSEIRPEWGLARNASFIIGQRELTQECDLEGRAFLHNYDWQQDESGEVLANIIAGPGTVAQMINLQYYASTVAPDYYGSGNKTTQTVTAGLGVMQGNASDLLSGLSWQSVMQSDSEAYHAPLRLLIVIQAPSEYVERLINDDPAFRDKIENGWVRLSSISPDGHWKNWY